MGEEPAEAGWARWAEIGGSAQPGSPPVLGEEAQAGRWRTVAPGVLGRADGAVSEPGPLGGFTGDRSGSWGRERPTPPPGRERSAHWWDPRVRDLNRRGGRRRERVTGRTAGLLGALLGAGLAVVVLARITGAAASLPAAEPSELEAGGSGQVTSPGAGPRGVPPGAAGETWAAEAGGGDLMEEQAPTHEQSAADPLNWASGGVDGVHPAVEEGPTDWWAVLAELDHVRSTALGARDHARLAGYAAPGSQMWEQDATLIEGLLAQDLTPVGLRTRVIAIEQAPGAVPTDPELDETGPELGQSDPERDRGGPGPDRLDPETGSERGDAVLVIVDERSAYTLEDRAGAVVHHVPASGYRRWRIALVRAESPGGGSAWRITSAESLP
jgi:hypothetical protein